MNRLICLCATAFCNNVLPKSEVKNPEYDELQAFFIICTIVLFFVILSCAFSMLFFEYGKKLFCSDNLLVQKVCDIDSVFNIYDENYVTSSSTLKRINSAPTILMNETIDNDICN